MKLYVMVLSIVLTTLGATSALAHEDHKHEAPAKAEISEERAKVRATEELNRLVSVKKIDATWKEGGFKSIVKKTYPNRWEWLITFESKAAEGKTLFVFLKSSGEFVAANFTGK